MPGTTLTVFDVAAYIMKKYAPMARKHGPISAMKLQKLVYYSQAWSLVWDEKPLFKEKIEAWVFGPVVRTLFDMNRGLYKPRKIGPDMGDPEKLNEDQQETVDLIVRDYGKLTPEELTGLTHQEPPWQKARNRAGLKPLERGSEKILHKDMVEYYSSLE